jgi:two-component system copper resistance phosphate regulon response regulator CusR
MKILVVEDETKTSAYLQKGLSENGFAVDIASDGEEGLTRSRAGDYDLVILDVMLPKRDGLSVLSELRKDGKETLSLVLSAKDGVQDRVRGLEMGADAYLVKPFAFSELVATIHSLLRRGPSRRTDAYRVADLEVDLIRHQATRAGKKLDLTPKEFSLLSLLIRCSGQTVSRTQISEQVWDMHFESDTNIVDVHIRRLRAKVDEPFPKKLIHTIRGIGYSLHEVL